MNAPESEQPAAMDEVRYDAGLLSDYGGGNVEWWQDYIRAELERAHEFYTEALTQQPAADTYNRRLKAQLEQEWANLQDLKRAYQTRQPRICG